MFFYSSARIPIINPIKDVIIKTHAKLFNELPLNIPPIKHVIIKAIKPPQKRNIPIIVKILRI